MNTKEQVWIFSLGRKITVYDIGKKLDPNISPSALGGFYTVKKELVKEGVISVENKGRARLLQAYVPKYFDQILMNLQNQNETRKKNEELFEKYVPKILDFVVEKYGLDENYDLASPFVFFIIVRYLATTGNYFLKSKPEGLLSKLLAFVSNLDENEKMDLKFKDRKEENIELLFTLANPKLFKDLFMELGIKIFGVSIFLHESFEYFLDTVNGENTEQERIELLEFLKKLRKKKPEISPLEDYEARQAWVENAEKEYKELEKKKKS